MTHQPNIHTCAPSSTVPPPTHEPQIIKTLWMDGFPPSLDNSHESAPKIIKPMKTIYGGVTGVRNYLKSLIIESIYKWEDSGVEIKNIYIHKIRFSKFTNYLGE